jgi:hypothetical protein
MRLPRLAAGEGLGIGCLLLVVGRAVLFLAFDSTGEFLYHQNEFVICVLFFAALVAADEAGYRLGPGTPAQASEETKTQTNHIQTAVFAVLGLLLAFSFSMAVSRFDGHKQALVEETNAIGTAYLSYGSSRNWSVPFPSVAFPLVLGFSGVSAAVRVPPAPPGTGDPAPLTAMPALQASVNCDFPLPWRWRYFALARARAAVSERPPA